MPLFKIGEKVRCIEGPTKGAGWELGKVFTIGKITDAQLSVGVVSYIYWKDDVTAGVFEDSLELDKTGEKIEIDMGDEIYVCTITEIRSKDV